MVYHGMSVIGRLRGADRDCLSTYLYYEGTDNDVENCIKAVCIGENENQPPEEVFGDEKKSFLVHQSARSLIRPG